jgi:ribosomal protein S18 acetylase RimI-like enzyme
LGLKGLTPADEDECLAALVAAGVYHNGYVICAEAQQPLWGAVAHREAHMTLESARWKPSGARVREAGLAELDAFYTRMGAGAWNPIQVETGPYVVYEEGGEILAAAGTHFAYPGLAQVGNVFTAPEARGRGLATLCTAAVVDRLVAAYPLVSLFVDMENVAARHVYEKLGFRTRRVLHAFPWQAAGQAL